MHEAEGVIWVFNWHARSFGVPSGAPSKNVDFWKFGNSVAINQNDIEIVEQKFTAKMIANILLDSRRGNEWEM